MKKKVTCEFCNGAGEFSRDNSDGVAIEGLCSFCDGKGYEEIEVEEEKTPEADKALRLQLRRETVLSYIERIKFKVETCEDVNTLNHIRIELFELLDRLG